MAKFGDDERGTGRTTKQMQDAPQGAIFVWCNNRASYARELARKIGRADLQIEPRNFLESDRRMGISKPVVIDHAYGWASR